MTPRFTRFIAAFVIAATGLSSAVAVAHDARADQTQIASTGSVPFEPRLAVSKLEAGLLHDACDGHWDEHSLFAAALIASGVANELEFRGTCELFAAINAELKGDPSRPATAEQRADKTLAFMHRRLLSGGYDLYATELPRVLATGRYNCVSATVLFNCLAAEGGLDVGALRLPNHTCAELADGAQRVRVETTCADWFAVRDRPRLFANAIGERAIVAGSPYENQPQEAISDVALVAMIYYNRGVEALARRGYTQAISLNRRAISLDPHNTQARDNLLSAINKQALSLAARN
jgi:hypothetical protein